MQFSTVLLALATATAASAGAVTSVITPTGAAPPGCTGSSNGNFEISVVKPAAKRAVEKRAACGGVGTLVLNIQNGILHDAQGRTGYIASNFQLQYDPPPGPQAGAIYTGGFAICPNSSLALGPTTVFYQCKSGGFFNLYNKNFAPQCEEVLLDTVPCEGSGSSSVATSASASAVTSSPATVISHAQPQFSSVSSAPASSAMVSEINDGQPQASSAAPAPTVAVAGGAAVEVAQNFVLAAAGLVGAALL